MTKIWLQNIFPDSQQSITDWGKDLFSSDDNSKPNMLSYIEREAAIAKREDTQLTTGYVKYSSYRSNTSYLEMLNNVWMVDGIIKAEKQGFDAAIIVCANDPALQQARQAVDIPVLGVAEAAMLFACQLGNKFGVITIQDDFVPLLERNIRNYGLSSRAVQKIQVYRVGDELSGASELLEKPELINPQFEELCHALITDGAEVIIPACVGLSTAASSLGFREVPGTGVPVLEITQVTVKMAEIWVELKKAVGLTKSQRGEYRSIDPEMRDQMRKFAKGI